MRASVSRALHLSILVLVGSVLVLVALAAFAHLLPPCAAKWVGLLTACPHRELTGTPCPLCGGMTALLALLRADLAQALAANVAALFIAPLIALQLPYRILRVYRPKLSVREEGILIGIGVLSGALLLCCAH